MQAVHAALPESSKVGMCVMRVVDVHGVFDPPLSPSLQWYWNGGYVTELTEAAIAARLVQGSNFRQVFENMWDSDFPTALTNGLSDFQRFIFAAACFEIHGCKGIFYFVGSPEFVGGCGEFTPAR